MLVKLFVCKLLGLFIIINRFLLNKCVNKYNVSFYYDSNYNVIRLVILL